MQALEASGALEEQARQTICRELSRLAHAGCGKFRVRWFPGEQRVQFQGQMQNQWSPQFTSNFFAAEAAAIAAAMAAIERKRNAVVEVTARSRSDHAIYEVRVDADNLHVHGPRLEEYLRGQLFWD